jgi:hypothetical protein
MGKYLSGLLLFKTMPDRSTRVIFSSEMGLNYFDFEFSYDGNFKVHYIIKKMNKKAVIKILRDDFALVLMHNLNPNIKSYFFNTSKCYTSIIVNDSIRYCSDSLRENVIIERFEKNKLQVNALLGNSKKGIPDSIGISHKNFNFNISLKLLEH